MWSFILLRDNCEFSESCVVVRLPKSAHLHLLPKASPPPNHIFHPSKSTSTTPDLIKRQSCAAHSCHIPHLNHSAPSIKESKSAFVKATQPFNCRRPHILDHSTVQSKEGVLIITNISSLNSSLYSFHPTASPLCCTSFFLYLLTYKLFIPMSIDQHCEKRPFGF